MADAPSSTASDFFGLASWLGGSGNTPRGANGTPHGANGASSDCPGDTSYPASPERHDAFSYCSRGPATSPANTNGQAVEDQELEPVEFAFVVPECGPNARLSVVAPDGIKLVVPCPVNVLPGMKLVLRKDEVGIWRIVHAKDAPEEVLSPAKFTPPWSTDATQPSRVPPVLSPFQPPAPAPVKEPDLGATKAPASAPALVPAPALAPASAPVAAPVRTQQPATMQQQKSGQMTMAERMSPPPLWSDPRTSSESRLGRQSQKENKPQQKEEEKRKSQGYKPGSITIAPPASGTVGAAYGDTSNPQIRPSRGTASRGLSPSSPGISTPGSMNRSTRSVGKPSSPRAQSRTDRSKTMDRPRRISGPRTPVSTPSSNGIARRSAAGMSSIEAPPEAPTRESYLRNSEAQKLKELIRGVYQRKNPSKLGELDALLEKHKGDEKGVYEHVCRKYGETPRPWSAKAQ